MTPPTTGPTTGPATDTAAGPTTAPGATGSGAPPVVIVADDLHVTFRVFTDNRLTLRRLTAQRFNGRDAEDVHAVRGVSFVARRGEVIGIVGANGSGKSTLLSAIAGLLPATSGSVLVSSQPALLGVSAALMPELSGHRNIVIGALAMGLPMASIREQLDEVAEFTELGGALARPLRTYSSGMKARLAFSIATMRTPEILLIDEALAVGDRHFREKSLARVRDIQAQAGTILMVTHNLNEIRTTCSRSLWLDDGALRADGPTEDVLAQYEAST